jgi:DNA replication initiation complex subunit (GINS family)
MWKTTTKDPGNPLTTKETPEQAREHVKLTEKNQSLPRLITKAGKPTHTKSQGDRQETDPPEPRQK